VRKRVLILCVFGAVFLVVGSVLAVPSVRNEFSMVIHSTGTIAHSDEASQPLGSETSLDVLGYLVIFGGVGFFAAAFIAQSRLRQS